MKNMSLKTATLHARLYNEADTLARRIDTLRKDAWNKRQSADVADRFADKLARDLIAKRAELAKVDAFSICNEREVSRERGESFDHVIMEADFNGPFDCAKVHKFLSPDYDGCLYRPVSIGFVTLVSPNLIRWERILSNS